MIKLGDLERVPVPHANAVSIHFVHKTEKNRKEKSVQIAQDRNCEQECIRLILDLTQERMLAGAESVIIRCYLLKKCRKHKVGR